MILQKKTDILGEQFGGKALRSKELQSNFREKDEFFHRKPCLYAPGFCVCSKVDCSSVVLDGDRVVIPNDQVHAVPRGRRSDDDLLELDLAVNLRRGTHTAVSPVSCGVRACAHNAGVRACGERTGLPPLSTWHMFMYWIQRTLSS